MSSVPSGFRKLDRNFGKSNLLEIDVAAGSHDAAVATEGFELFSMRSGARHARRFSAEEIASVSAEREKIPKIEFLKTLKSVLVENVDGAVVGFQDRAEELISRLYNNFEATPKDFSLFTSIFSSFNPASTFSLANLKTYSMRFAIGIIKSLFQKTESGQIRISTEIKDYLGKDIAVLIDKIEINPDIIQKFHQLFFASYSTQMTMALNKFSCFVGNPRQRAFIEGFIAKPFTELQKQIMNNMEICIQSALAEDAPDEGLFCGLFNEEFISFLDNINISIKGYESSENADEILEAFFNNLIQSEGNLILGNFLAERYEAVKEDGPKTLELINSVSSIGSNETIACLLTESLMAEFPREDLLKQKMNAVRILVAVIKEIKSIDSLINIYERLQKRGFDYLRELRFPKLGNRFEETKSVGTITEMIQWKLVELLIKKTNETPLLSPRRKSIEVPPLVNEILSTRIMKEDLKRIVEGGSEAEIMFNQYQVDRVASGPKGRAEVNVVYLAKVQVKINNFIV